MTPDELVARYADSLDGTVIVVNADGAARTYVRAYAPLVKWSSYLGDYEPESDAYAIMPLGERGGALTKDELLSRDVAETLLADAGEYVISLWLKAPTHAGELPSYVVLRRDPDYSYRDAGMGSFL